MGRKTTDLTNQRFGSLIAREYLGKSNGRSKWLCECDCGNWIEVLAANLKSGHTQSCGCLKKTASQYIDKTFGHLKVKEVMFKKTRDNGSGYTLCRCECDCGETTIVRLDNVISGHTTSCGKCDKNDRVFNLKNDFTQHTQISKIKFDKKPGKANKSGIVGVHYNKAKNRWVATICFQGQQKTLGYFREIDEAIDARKKAEKEIFGDFIEWYNNFKKPKK